MDKKELARRSQQILEMKRDLFAAVDLERYEEADFLLDLIKRLQKRMVKKLLEKDIQYMKELPVNMDPLESFQRVVVMGIEFLETCFFSGSNTYKLKISPGRFEFCLTLPGGTEISDTFSDMHIREALYCQLEDGKVYKWLRDVELRIEQLNESDGIRTIIIPVEHYCYHLKVNSIKKELWIQCPQFCRSFQVNELDSSNPDLLVIVDYQVEQIIRRTLVELGLDIPLRYTNVGK